MTQRPPEEPIQGEIDINDEMAQSFVDYAMSVIVSRALPDARDGLKPVQRRIVYSMFESNMGPDTAHEKCAQVVGDVMGRYHPHSQDAIYEALVRMGQTFSVRHLLIDPQGNFGTVDDPPGAMRYTEARLSELAFGCSTGSMRTRSTSPPTTPERGTSRRSFPPGSPTSSSTAHRGSPWGWPPTSPRTTWER